MEKTYLAVSDTASALVPAVPVKRSVFPNYLICLEDGKKLKMLKRHLSSAYGMTIDEYRERWGLPREYPMVAPSYSAQRSALAHAVGLGRTITAKGNANNEILAPGMSITKIPMRRRGRKKMA